MRILTLFFINLYYFSLLQSNETDEKVSYRNQVIRALVQRYIDSARREFEETKRKGMTQEASLSQFVSVGQRKKKFAS